MACMLEINQNNSITISTHVSPPKPIDVKKLIANRVFLGLSRGNKPSNANCILL